MQKDKSGTRKINFKQALVYPFYQGNCWKLIFIAGIFNFVYMLIGLIAGGIIYDFVFHRGLDVYIFFVLVYIASFLAIPLPCWMGYGWRVLYVVRENGYNTVITDPLPEEIILSGGWLLLWAYWLDGLKLMLCFILFILLPASVFCFVPFVLIRDITLWQFESIPVMFFLGALLCIACTPFYLSAIIQSAEKRRLFDLINIQRAFLVGKQCYGNSLIALFSTIIIFSLYTSMVALFAGWHNEFLLVLPIPAFVAATLTSIQIIGQSFDDYRDDNSTTKQILRSDQTQAWISLGYSNLVSIAWLAIAALPWLLQGVAHNLLSFLDQRSFILLAFRLLALLVGGCISTVGFVVIAGRERNNKYYDAIGKYTRAIELNPQDVQAYINRGDAYEALDKIQKAINDYSRAICLEPKAEAAYKNRAKLYFEAKQYEHAIEDYSIVISQNSKYTLREAYEYRGCAYDLLGQYQRAVDDYSMVITYDPGNSWAGKSRDIASAKILESK